MNLAMKRNTERELLKTQMVMIPPSVAEPMDPMISRFGGLRLLGESSRSVAPPMDPMQQCFGGLKFTGESSQSVVPPMDPKIQRFGGLGLTGESSESVMPPLLMDEPKEKRKMFATFSKGHLVFEGELWGYFNRMFGGCLATVWSSSLCRFEESHYPLTTGIWTESVGIAMMMLPPFSEIWDLLDWVCSVLHHLQSVDPNTGVNGGVKYNGEAIGVKNGVSILPLLSSLHLTSSDSKSSIVSSLIVQRNRAGPENLISSASMLLSFSSSVSVRGCGSWRARLSGLETSSGFMVKKDSGGSSRRT
nr:uncharacterized protein LOC109160696 isoform X2 [Ipomoea batatas]